MNGRITLCIHPRPLVLYAVSCLLGEYNLELCNRGCAEVCRECPATGDVLVRIAPSTYCLPLPVCTRRQRLVPTLLVSTGWVEAEDAVRHAGYSGYIGPACRSEQLQEAVKTLMEGGSFYHPGERSTHPVGFLTFRQLQVLRLVGKGFTDHEIASELKIAETTVRHHLDVLFDKLGVRRRGELAAAAALGGLCDDTGDWWWFSHDVDAESARWVGTG
ncbi:MAG: LuxR C-terminal-related transcriptional regulator [Armatimonadota bacterium]